MEALGKSCNIFWVWFGIPGHAQRFPNDKVSISLGRAELFYLFIACSYISVEATVLSYRFIWIWSAMPKIL